MLRIYEIKLGLQEELKAIPGKIEKKLHLKPGEVFSWEIVQESVDARNKKEIKRVYSVLFQVKDEKRALKGKGSVRVEPVSEEEVSFWKGMGLTSGAYSFVPDEGGATKNLNGFQGEKSQKSGSSQEKWADE